MKALARKKLGMRFKIAEGKEVKSLLENNVQAAWRNGVVSLQSESECTS